MDKNFNIVGRLKENLPFVSVDYDEFHPETYRGILIDWEGKQTRVFSGDFVKDYNRVQFEYIPFNFSSSLNNFINDAKLALNDDRS